MNRILNVITICYLLLLAGACGSILKEKDVSNDFRDKDFNFNWQFQLVGDTSLSSADLGDLWQDVQLPHDWSIAQEYDSTLDGATAYLPGGIGWYKKTFHADQQPDEVTHIVFDGVYNRSTVWLNGKELGFHPYGYSPFTYNLTDHLKQGENELIVKVDRSRYIDSRWYPGAGIYRNVTLVTTNKLHVPVWGTFVSTPEVSKESALVSMDIKINNAFNEARKFDVVFEIFDPNGIQVATSELKDQETPDGEESLISEEIQLANPSLWSVDTPNLYRVDTKLLVAGAVVGGQSTTFGVRSIKFDPNTGFFLNGENMKIKGVCLHHDAGLVGSAVPKGVWKRRLQALKDGGCNAVRIAHNPGSQEFLDLCDEMGILVQDEFYDEWDYPKDKRLNQEERHDDYISRGHAEFFQDWAEDDLKTVVEAHRNHPSIIQWSIGNEIEWTYHPRYRNITGYFNMKWNGNYFWEQPPISREQIIKNHQTIPSGKYELAKTAQKLADWTKEMDTSRPVIANCILPSASHVTGYGDALDIVGYSYRRVMYDYGHQYYPDKIIMGTENLGQWHEWKAVLERPFISGVFLWTGIDYMGESHGRWPRKALPSGILDITGFKKPSFYMFKSLWTEEPTVYIASQTQGQSNYTIDESTGEPIEKRPGAWKTALWIWQDVNTHWNYEADELVMVEVYSNCEEVELFLNEKSLGIKKLADFEDRIYKWAVPFEPGDLVAKGIKNGKNTEYAIRTAGKTSSIALNVDKNKLVADNYDVAHIELQLTDDAGNPVATDDKKVTFEISGDVKLLGVDNGAPDNVQPHQTNAIVTSKGRALLIVQAKNTASKVSIKASSEGLNPALVEIEVMKASK